MYAACAECVSAPTVTWWAPASAYSQIVSSRTCPDTSNRRGLQAALLLRQLGGRVAGHDEFHRKALRPTLLDRGPRLRRSDPRATVFNRPIASTKRLVFVATPQVLLPGGRINAWTRLDNRVIEYDRERSFRSPAKDRTGDIALAGSLASQENKRKDQLGLHGSPRFVVHGAVVREYGLASELGANGTYLVVNGILLVSWDERARTHARTGAEPSALGSG